MTETKKQTIDRADLVIRICMIICLLFTIVIYIYGQFFVKNASLYANQLEEFDAVWSYTDHSGVTKKYRTNETFNVEGDRFVRLTLTLPDTINDGSCLFLQAGMDLDAYIDGDLRNSYKLTKSIIGRNVKSVWVPITLRKGDSGKTLTIVRPGYLNSIYSPSEVYIGNRLGFAMTLIHDNLFIIVLGFAIIVFSLVITAICLAYRVLGSRPFPLWYLSLGVLGGAIWLILDNFTYPLFFQNYFVDGIAEYLVVMLIPFPFAAYTNSLLDGRYKKLYYPVAGMVIVDFVILTILDFTGTADFNETMLISNIVSGVVGFFCFGTLLYDTYVKGNREHTGVSIGFTFFVALTLTEIIHLNLPVHTNDGIFMAIGLLELLVVAVTHEIKRISDLKAETLEARNANRAKTTFLANMSHEIRTPINAILGMDELILRENSNPKVREYAQNIKDAGTALLDIISDVLDFSKIEQGRMDITNSDYDTKSLINSVITMTKVRADAKNLSFIRNISQDLPSQFNGDEKRIREILMNLLSNAVKYTPAGSVTLSVKHEDTGEGRANLMISVKDTGIGIKESDRSRLFKQFERLDQKKNRSIEGTGLGLTIAANLVKLMGGTIDYESTYGKGTEFKVVIPQGIADSSPMGSLTEDTAPADKTTDSAQPRDLEGVKILVVDDSKVNLKVAGGLLNILKANVTTCVSGAEMLDLITKEKFDVILLDHMMPEMDGIETLQKAKTLSGNLNSDTPYIALTANAIAGVREMYLENGFSDYLAKPVKLELLSSTINSNLGRDI